MPKYLYLPALIFCAACAHVQHDTVPKGKLPNLVRPLSYHLDLSIDPKERGFSGKTTISIELLHDTSQFWMHSKNSDIQSAMLANAAGTVVPLNLSVIAAEDLLKLTSPSGFKSGKYTLTLKYESLYENGLLGMYKVSEEGSDYVFTQFEPIAARACFPSFDEPRFKTPFSYQLTVPKGMTAITNTPLANEVVRGESKILNFSQSKPLPTYLVAFAVGPFDVVEAPDIAPNAIRQHSLPFRGVAVKGKGHLLKTALKETPAMVEFQEHYTGIHYPYAKLDIIAIPDFASGAMENVGAITFREWLLLIDPLQGSESQKRAFASVMAHELAHQWFGNLVTMPWWNDLWLNEAFATWFGYKTIENLYPDHHADLGLLQRMHSAMNADSLTVARRVREPIHSNHDIYNAFDSITYAKGASILGMLENVVGTAKMKSIIRSYLSEFPHATATGFDFLRAIETNTSSGLAQSFQSFIENPGVPLITASVACQDNTSRIAFDQKRYAPIGSTIETDDRWTTPVCFRASSSHQTLQKCRLVKNGHFQDLDFCPTSLDLNPSSKGYFLSAVNFSTGAVENAPDLVRITPRALSHLKNLSAQFRSGLLTSSNYMAALKPFSASSSRHVKTAPLRDLEFILRHEPKTRPETLAFVRAFYQDALRNDLEIQADETPEKLIYLRTIYDLFLSHDLHFVAPKSFQKFAADELAHTLEPAKPSTAPNDLKSVALRYALRTSDPSVFEKLSARMEAEKDTAVRNRLLYGLSSTENNIQVQSALNLIKSPKVLRKNELFQVGWNLLSHQNNQETVWSWVRENYNFLKQNVPRKRLSNLPYTAENFCSEDKRLELLSFLGPEIDSIPGGPPALAEVSETISLCAALANNSDS